MKLEIVKVGLGFLEVHTKDRRMKVKKCSRFQTTFENQGDSSPISAALCEGNPYSVTMVNFA
jgi:hypothetical protein